MKLWLSFSLFFLLVPFSGALGQETVTYTFDALGRLIKVGKVGGTVGSVEAVYDYDRAGNRTNVSVTSPNDNNGGDPGDGASFPERDPLYVAVPLNGYTLVRVH